MYFSNMKEKMQKAYRITSYDEVLSNTLISMFVYRGNNVPKEILDRQSFIDRYSIFEGIACVFKLTEDILFFGNGNETYKDKYVIAHGGFAGEPDEYGFGKDIIIRTDSGITHTFENWIDNPDVAVFFNNSTYSPDMNVGRYSDMLSELELSMKLNVIFSRMYPIPVAKSQKVKKAIEEAITNMMDGKISTILDEDKLAQYISDTTKEAIEIVNLTDEEKSAYIQYLSHFRDDLMRWFYGLYGMNSQGSAKMAQQSVSEVNQDSPASMILPHDMLRSRMNGCQMCNEKFGWDMEVSFSECWMSRLANMDDEFKTTDEELEEGETDGISKDSTDNSDTDTEDKKSEEVEEKEEGEKDESE